MTVFVISKYGERLMPTARLGKVRHMLKDGRAVILRRHPFTIQLTYETTAYTQPVEVCVDTGYQHIGVSVKSAVREYAGEEYDLLRDEKQRHDDSRRYRRERRNRKRYRAPRFYNRRASKKAGWLPPSLKNKADRHVDLIRGFMGSAPVTSITLEVGQFDPVVLNAIDKGLPLPSGLDYQFGPRYGCDTLREAVFQRDHYQCLVCKRSTQKDGAILHLHHGLYWKGIHRDRLDECMTVCEQCHTPANHKAGGKLWGLVPKDFIRGYPEAAFMNSVRWYIYQRVKEASSADVNITYGAITKASRMELGLTKSHANDAYAMGTFHPTIRSNTVMYQKRRRNNRVLSRFYDAKYIDSRDGAKRSGSELSNGRINRNHKQDSENLHPYRACKASKGRVSTRTQHHSLQPHDRVSFQGNEFHVSGTHCHGSRVILLETKKSVAVAKVTTLCHAGGWYQI